VDLDRAAWEHFCTNWPEVVTLLASKWFDPNYAVRNLARKLYAAVPLSLKPRRVLNHALTILLDEMEVRVPQASDEDIAHEALSRLLEDGHFETVARRIIRQKAWQSRRFVDLLCRIEGKAFPSLVGEIKSLVDELENNLGAMNVVTIGLDDVAPAARRLFLWLVQCLTWSGQWSLVDDVVREPSVMQCIGIEILERVQFSDVSQPFIHGWLDGFIPDSKGSSLSTGELVETADDVGVLLRNQPHKFSDDHLRRLILYPYSHSWTEQVLVRGGWRTMNPGDGSHGYDREPFWAGPEEYTTHTHTIRTSVPYDAKEELRRRGLL